MKGFLLITTLVLATMAQELPVPQQNSTLRAVIQVFRHGIRESIHKLNQNGDLTPPGMRQQYLLGAALRDEYILKQHFLSENYIASEYKIKASNVDRALESAYSQLMGLFPNGPHLPTVNHSLIPNRFHQNDSAFSGLENNTALPFGFQTVPVHASSNEVSSLKAIYEGCQTYLQIVDANKRSPIYEKLTNEFSATIDEALRLGSIPVGSVPREERLLRAAEVYIDLKLDYYNNQEVVLFNNQSVFWRNLTFLASISRYVTHFQTDFQKRLTNTPIFDEFRNFLDSRIRKNSPLKWLAFSAHDTNLMQIFAGLNISSWECIYRNFQANPDNYSTPDCHAERPQLSSNIILELHEVVQPTLKAFSEEDDILVEKKKKRYENFELRALIDGVPVNLCGNQTSCNYLEFRNRIKDYIFNEDFYKICGLPEHELEKNNLLSGTESSGTDIFLIIFIMIETVVLVGLFLRFWDDRKERNRILRGENDGLTIPLRI